MSAQQKRLHLITKSEAAKLAGYSTDTIDRRAAKGKLTKYKDGHSARFDAEEVMALFKPVKAVRHD